MKVSILDDCDFTQRNGTSTNLAVDVGGVLEYFVRPGMAIRMDWGDIMVRFPHAVNTGPFTRPSRPAGITAFKAALA